MRCYAGYWFRVRLVGMNKQLSFSASEYAGKKNATRRERFLGEMEEVVPWGKLIALIEPCYHQG